MAGPLQGPAAAAALDRTPYGKSSAGGKIRSSRHHQNSHLQEQQHRNALGAFRDSGSGGAAAPAAAAAATTTPVRRGPYDRPVSGRHASAIAPRRSLGSRILNGASSFLSSLLFRRQSLPSPGDEQPLEEGFVSVSERVVLSTETGASEDVVIEDILKDRVFTREQCDRFIKVLQSKLGEQPQVQLPLSNGLIEDRFPDEELEREFERERDTERRRPPPLDDTISMDDDEPGTSPIDIAKAYMDKRLSPVPSAFPVRTLEYTPVRSREDLPRVATPGHTPYVRLRPAPGKMYDIRPTPYPVRTSAAREKKRRVDDDSDYTARRTRLKISNGPPSSTLPSSSNDFGNGSYLDRMRNLQRKRGERRGTEDSAAPVPAQSSETARKILETLEILTPPKLKSLEQELTAVREKRPKELSPSMLNDKARKTLQTIDYPAPEPRVEPEKPAPSEAHDARPAPADVKGKGVTTSPEPGPSATGASGSKGFRMNAVLEESNSDDEGLAFSSQVNAVPKPLFHGFGTTTSAPKSSIPPSAPSFTTTVPVTFTSAAPEASKAIPVAPASTTALPVLFPSASAASPAAATAGSEATFSIFATTESAIASSNASVASTTASPITSPSAVASAISTRASESTITSTSITGVSTSFSPTETKIAPVKDSPAGFTFAPSSSGGFQTSIAPFGSAGLFSETKVVPAASDSSPGLSNNAVAPLGKAEEKTETKGGLFSSNNIFNSGGAVVEAQPLKNSSENEGGMANGSSEILREAKKPAFSFGTGSSPLASTSPSFSFTGASSAGFESNIKPFSPGTLTTPSSSAGTSTTTSTTTTPVSAPFAGSGLFPPPSGVQFPAFTASSSSASTVPFIFGANTSASFSSAGTPSSFGFNVSTASTTTSDPSSGAAAAPSSIFGTPSPNPFTSFPPAIAPASSPGGGSNGDMDMGEEVSAPALPNSGFPGQGFIFGSTGAPSAPSFTSSVAGFGASTPPAAAAPAAPLFPAPGAPGSFSSNPFGSAPAFGSAPGSAPAFPFGPSFGTGSTPAFVTQAAPPAFTGNTTPSPFGVPVPPAAGAAAGSEAPGNPFTAGVFNFTMGTEGGGEQPKRRYIKPKRTGSAKRGGK